MLNIFKISILEFNHFKHAKLKIISLLLYFLALIYGAYNGLELYRNYNSEIKIIRENISKSISQSLNQYEEIKNNEIKKPRRDPTSPYWAVRNTHSYEFKNPSRLTIFSVGQSEQYGYYKKITNWSTVFDSDLAKEIANPERLAIGTLDFSFVILYLGPILFIVLLFNIGGLEKDYGFERFVYLTNINEKYWLLLRFLFYYFITAILIMSVMIPFYILSSSAESEFSGLMKIISLILIYNILWFCIFYFINLKGMGSIDQSVKMIFTWLSFCIIIPGMVHQIVSINYPLNYMTDYIDTNRDISYDIFDLPQDTLKLKMLNQYPSLKHTKFGADTTIREDIINRSISSIINNLNKILNKNIEIKTDKKNNLINQFNFFNPVTFFQNKINSVAKSDYISFRNYRKKIQSKIDKQIHIILNDTWNQVTVDQDIYQDYINKLK